MSAGALVLVATPIGNLGDLSPRAREVLTAADVVACEDTRRTGRLFALAGLDVPRLLLVNDHTEARAARQVVDLVAGGATVAVVTDAGSPGVSDPGERLVRAVAGAGLAVTVVPGPSAVIAALTVSGLPSGRFVMEGFLPRRGSARSARLADLASERRTVVLFESPHRVAATLAELAERLGGDRRVAIVRELTKLHEEIWRGALDEAASWAATAPVRGEVTVVVEGAPEPEAPGDDQVRARLAELVAAGSTRRDAAATAAAELGVSKRRAYDLANELA